MPPPWLWVTIRHRGQRPSLSFRSDEEAVRERKGGGGGGEKEEQPEGERGSSSGGKREWKIDRVQRFYSILGKIWAVGFHPMDRKLARKWAGWENQS
jgi:hypothetical protein